MDILIFIVALSILVLVHEFGHYIAAVKTGVRVEEFGLGLPPRIIGKKIGETVFSLNLLPIGGFCKLYGEDGDGKGKEAFNTKKPWQKLLVVLGGVLMNLVLAVAIFSMVYTIMGVPQETDRVKIIEIVPNSPADKAGLRVGDWIKAVETKPVSKPVDVTDIASEYKGKNVALLVSGDNGSGPEKRAEVAVRENPPEGEGSMGIAISNIEMIKVPWYEFHKGIVAGFQEAYFWGKIIAGGVAKMVGDLFMGQVPKDVSGPIGMYEATSMIKKNQGMLALIHFFGIISVNLAIVNILPFPALDGGRILFVGYEFLTGKRANQRFEAMVNNFGMLVLLGLILIITVSDIFRLATK